MIVLGIETSCDETSAGIVDTSGNVLANVVASQVDIHARYGGIVPEIASRQHVIDIRSVVTSSLQQADKDWNDLDAIAVTHGPGLAGSLIIGLNMAKGLSAATGVPLVGVNHLEGHIFAAWATLKDRPVDSGENDRELLDGVLAEGKSVMCLLVSGGHTELVLLHPNRRFELIGGTRDDAAGEAFDKVARVLGLRYPGGPEIQRVATMVTSEPEPLSRAWMKGTYDFSFSGIKTAVLNRARREGIYPPAEQPASPDVVANLARAFQDSVVDVLVTKTLAAAAEFGCGAIVVAGGVAANGPLREAFHSLSPVPVVIPPISLCTDNGAMIAMAGAMRFSEGARDGWGLDVEPGLRIGSVAVTT